MKYLFLLFSAVLFFLIGCSASPKTFKEQEILLKKISLEKYGTNFDILYNSDKSYSIVIKKEKASVQHPNPLLVFFLYNLASDKIVFEDTVAGGKIAWLNREQVEVSTVPGTVSLEHANNKFGYLYNAATESKADINSSQQNQNR